MVEYRIDPHEISDLDGFSVELTVGKVKTLLENGLDRKAMEATFFSVVNQGESESDFCELLETASHLQRATGRPVLVHLRAGDISAVGVLEFLKRVKALELSNFLIITGDKRRLDDGFSTGLALLSALRDAAGDEITLASTIDVNQAAGRTATMLLEEWEKRNECGADFAITQIFFEPEMLIGLRKKLENDAVIVPGLVSGLSEKQVGWIECVLGITVPMDFRQNPVAFNKRLKERLNKSGFGFFHYFGMD
ncbi:hypothetical protein G6R29_02810 [Fructobacillus sp. M2-14]|uniref:Methylenetetrahydrofolate reductase n=1 Tax=Fructobacillus broussonetiae TaxID=2713173 RepID=A0ABS5R1Z0_9LACO|nr:methylenetetrahydrofolate reductase [Fructobacillus broussonetiae]MBS9338564.1 hypothetical protein [Fructobacillus broussonetiae]